MPSKPRVYLSVPDDIPLTDEQLSVKKAILKAIEDKGMELQMGVTGQTAPPLNGCPTF